MRRFVLKTIRKWALLAASGYLATGLVTFGQVAGPQTGAAPVNQTPFQMKVTSNLVVVRVVVRNAQGQPIANLTKEDFRVLDRGKLQSISQFAADASLASSRPSLTPPSGEATNAVSPWSSLPQRFFALYFDDLNMTVGDIVNARNAAERYLAKNLGINDRVALYTSGNSLSDFTGDPKQIHDALDKLQFNPLAIHDRKCPEISDYQAQQITEFDDERIDAWVVAIDQAKHDQRCSQVPGGPGEPQRYIAVLARQVLELAGTRSRANLQELQKVVDYVSQMPGQRTIILISPGFLSRSEQPDLDRIIDHALRAEVVIHSLDPRGLASLTREQDVTHSYMPVAANVVTAVHEQDEERESNARDILAEVSHGTGGEFVHDSNDLEAGFKSLAAVPAYYLGFAPTDIKPDGKFHDLKVELAQGHRGFSIEARRGYFAPGSRSESGKGTEQAAATDTDAQMREQLREAVFAKSDLPQLPLSLDVKVFSTLTEDREVLLTGHLDTKSLSGNKVTFVSAVFDSRGNLLKLQRGDGQVEADGAKMDSTFQLKPGTYRFREVVTEGENHDLAALSREVNVAAECCAPRELASVPPVSTSPPALPRPGAPVPTNVETSYLDYPLRKLRGAVPALGDLKPDDSQQELPRILSRVGEVTQASLAAVPNLTAQEDVYSFVAPRDSAPVNSVLGLRESPALLNLEAQLRETRSIEFNYLLLFDHHADGATTIRELRTDLKNRPVNQVALHGFGFAYQWLLLTSANQSELRFRYFGKQTMNGHQTYVLGFVQVPSLVKLPAKYQWANQEAPFYFQGVAWIDQSSFQIVRLRTDLLSPVPSLNLEFLTTELHFGSVHIHGFNSELWLPSEVLIRTVRSDTIFQELHDYGRYRFFHAEGKLVP